MRISPLDIQQQTFRSAFRGLDRKEVQAFLDLIRSEMEEILRENQQLRGEIHKMEGLLGDYRAKEQALKETMVTAQKLVEDIKGGAKKEAELLIGQAELQAERITNQAYQRLAKMVDEIGELKRQRVQFIASFQAALETQRKLLAVMEEEDRERERGKFEEKSRYVPREASGKA